MVVTASSGADPLSTLGLSRTFLPFMGMGKSSKALSTALRQSSYSDGWIMTLDIIFSLRWCFRTSDSPIFYPYYFHPPGQWAHFHPASKMMPGLEIVPHN